MNSKSNVAIYCDKLLPISTTFIKSQAEAFRDFTPYYVGSSLVKKGLILPSERTLVSSKGGFFGKVDEVYTKIFGFHPSFIESLRTLRPKLIHAHFGPNGVVALPLARELQIPLIVTFHGLDATVKKSAKKFSYRYWQYFRSVEKLKREAGLFIAVSDSIKEKLVEQNFPNDKILVHYIGVNNEQFQPNVTLARESTVLFVGRLVEKKGCEYLIRAMAQLQATATDVELVIIGDGPLKPQLETLASQLLRRYRFLGSQNSSQVKEWMNRSQVFCAPSVTASTGDSEGAPIVLLEAQAMGLPVVSSYHSGIPEIITHGDNGFLAAERNWQEIAKYISLLLENKLLWQKFSNRGIESVQTKFDLHKQTHVLENVYQKILDKGGKYK